MKTTLNPFLAALAFAGVSLSVQRSHAANLTWDATTNTTWNTSTANWIGTPTTFTNGDDVTFSSASTKGALTLGSSVSPLSLRSNGANTPATITTTGAAGFTLGLGNGSAGTGNITAADGSSAFEQNLTYNMSGSGSAFGVVAGSGTSVSPTLWNIATGKTFLISAGTTGQISDLNANTVNLTGPGTVTFQSGTTLRSSGGTGTFNVNAGILTFAGGSNRNTSVENSVTVNVGPSGRINMAPNSGAGSTFSQATNLNGGTLASSGGGVATVAGTVTLGATTTSSITLAPATTLNSLTGSGSANLTAGTLILANASTLSGGTISVSGGTLQIGNASALGTDLLRINGGGTATVNAGLSVGNSLTMTRGATSRAILTLGNGSTWSGPITVDNTATQTTGSQFAAILSGGTTAATASVVSGNIGFSTLGSASQPALVLRNTATFGKVTGSVSLSTGTVQFLDATNWEFSHASNTWGSLDVSNAGAIATVGAANTLSSSGIVTSTVGGTLRLNNQAGDTAYNQSIAGLSGNMKVGLLTGAATLTLNTTADQSGSGVISGAISLIKSGSAKQTLTGLNTYTGSTTINGGTLALGTTGTIGTGDLSISSATLDLRKGTSTRTLSVPNLSLDSATLEIGLNASPDAVNVTGTTSISGSNVIKLYGTVAAGTYSLITSQAPLTGNFTLDTSGVTVSGFTGSYTAAIQGNDYVLTVGGTDTPFSAYWQGDVSSVWSDSTAAPNSNWATDGGGSTDTSQLPGAITDVYFSSSSASNTNTSLGADISVNRLTFESGTASVGGANTLSILATSGFALTVLDGANVTLNTAATAITGTAGIDAGGTLTVNGGGLGSGTLLVSGTLNLNMSVSHAVLNGSSTGLISRSIPGNSTLSVSGTANSNFAGTINDGSGIVALAKTGSSTLILSAANGFSGGTSLTSGVIQAEASGALGSGSIIFSGSSQRLSLGNNVTLTNAITLGGNNGEQGAGLLEAATNVTGEANLEGAITITANPFGGGHFANRGNGVFNVKGAVTSSVVVVLRIGRVSYSGGGSYASMRVTGTAALGGNNGLATNAALSIGVSGAGTFDLAGYNQSLAGIVKDVSAATIGNSSTTADSVLTTTGTSTFAGTIVDSVSGGTRKLGLTVNGGALTLGGLNTYTGNTTVNSGALTLSDNAQLRFAIGAASGTTNTLTGASATLNGDFNIDTTLADASALTSGTWTLENVTSLTGAYGSTFQVLSGSTAWTSTGDTWSKTVGAKTYTFDETTGVLTLSSGGYDSWASSKGLSGPDADFDADPDQDGLDNGLEFVLGGEPNPANPGSNSASLLPIATEDSGDLTFTFKRKDLSESGVALNFQWSNDLTFPSPASDVPVTAEDSVTDTIAVNVAEDSPDADTDTVTITVPAAKAVGGKIFGRLKAVKVP